MLSMWACAEAAAPKASRATTQAIYMPRNVLIPPVPRRIEGQTGVVAVTTVIDELERRDSDVTVEHPGGNRSVVLRERRRSISNRISLPVTLGWPAP
jgi:hypothetical protein